MYESLHVAVNVYRLSQGQGQGHVSCPPFAPNPGDASMPTLQASVKHRRVIGDEDDDDDDDSKYETAE